MREEHKLVLDEVKGVAKKNQIILSVIIRGSYVEENMLDESSEDIDFSIIIKKDSSAKRILRFKEKFNNISKKYRIRVSSTIVDIGQIEDDLKKGIHFHGAISSSFIFQLSNSKIIYGKNIQKLISSFEFYDPYTSYFNAVRFIDKIFDDYFMRDRNKKGINYSFILARECAVTKGLITSNKDKLIEFFKKHLKKKEGERLSSIKKMRKKKVLKEKDMQIIYSFLKYCRDYLGSFLEIEDLKDIKKLNDSIREKE